MNYTPIKITHIDRIRSEEGVSQPAGSVAVEILALVKMDNNEPVIAFFDGHTHSLRTYGCWYPSEEERLDFVTKLIVTPADTSYELDEVGAINAAEDFLRENSTPLSNIEAHQSLLVKGCGAFQLVEEKKWRVVTGSQSDLALACAA